MATLIFKTYILFLSTQAHTILTSSNTEHIDYRNGGSDDKSINHTSVILFCRGEGGQFPDFSENNFQKKAKSRGFQIFQDFQKKWKTSTFSRLFHSVLNPVKGF